MITVNVQYLRSAAAGGRADLRAEKAIKLTLLDSRSQVFRVVESDDVRAWAKQLTGLDFARAKLTSRGAKYKPSLKHGTDHYIFWIWKGSAKNPSPTAQYGAGTEPIGTDQISLRIELMYGKGERPRSSG